MKKRIISLIAGSLFCFGGQVAAQQVKYKSVADFVRTVGGSVQTEMQINADLNGDNLADWTGIVTQGESNRTNRLYVLLQTGDRAFVVADQSAESAASTTGSYYIDDLSAERGSVFVTVSYKSGSQRVSKTVQFKPVNQRWRLIGSKIFDFDTDKDFLTETDTNFLTGAVIITKQKGDNKPVAKRFKSKRPAQYLKDYDLYDAAGIR